MKQQIGIPQPHEAIMEDIIRSAIVKACEDGIEVTYIQLIGLLECIKLDYQLQALENN